MRLYNETEEEVTTDPTKIPEGAIDFKTFITVLFARIKAFFQGILDAFKASEPSEPIE